MTFKDFFRSLFNFRYHPNGTCIAKISFDPVEVHEGDEVKIGYELSCSSPKVVPNVTINGKRIDAHTT